MSLFNDFLSLIYPRHCRACKGLLFGHEREVCNHCRIGLPRTDFHIVRDSPLHAMLKGRIPYEKLGACFPFEKQGHVQRLLHAVKYEGCKELGVSLGKWYGEELKRTDFFKDIDIIIPVPLHPKKLVKRGYNQSEVIALGLSEVCGLPVVNGILVRTVESQTQTRRGKFERWENVEGIFQVKDSDKAEGKHILLVDDVITTGATLEAAWLALKGCKGLRISVASLAYAPKKQ